MKADWERLAEGLGLKPHPEGGFFRETYRSAHSTAIYYLIQPGGRSGWHRIKSDELFHFYDGGPSPKNPQHAVKAGAWFGAHLNEGSPYALIGCTVAPPFEFASFEMIKDGELARRYPARKDFIARLRD